MFSRGRAYVAYSARRRFLVKKKGGKWIIQMHLVGAEIPSRSRKEKNPSTDEG